MRRKIRINYSDKIVCKYFDNGYCRFELECKFYHPLEICKSDHCEMNTCEKRHLKFCKYFRQKRCKFSEKCLFSHDKNKVARQNSDVNPESEDLEVKVKSLLEVIKDLKNEMKIKDLEIISKNDIIEKNNIEINRLSNENKDGRFFLSPHKV